jgi:Protein of unknown function (DUF3108)
VVFKHGQPERSKVQDLKAARHAAATIMRTGAGVDLFGVLRIGLGDRRAVRADRLVSLPKAQWAFPAVGGSVTTRLGASAWKALPLFGCNFWASLRPTVFMSIKHFRFDAPVRGTLSSRFVHAWPTFCLIVALISLLDARPAFAAAQTKLDATYTATLLGLQIGEISWTAELRDNRFNASARGAVSGLLRIFSDGHGDVSVHGALTEGKPAPSNFALKLVAGKWSDDVRIVFSGDKAHEYVATASANANPDRIPLTDAHRKGVLDPMSAMLIPTPGVGKAVTSQTCERELAVFDGHARYDLRLAFKRFEDVKTDGGYQGGAVVCAVRFNPVAGHDPKRYLVTYLAAHRDFEIWLVPLAGSRLLVPYRASIPTPVGQGILEATSFVVRP